MTVLALALAAAACGGGGDTPRTGGLGPVGPALPAAQLTLVAYSAPQDAYEEIIGAFRRTPEGRNITFARSYGGSGEQSRAVMAGLAADIVAFALEPDMARLVRAGLVAADWATDGAGPPRYGGMITRSVVVLATRKGNPRRVTGWADLTRAGFEVVTPNPFTSGGARWNVMAAYGQALDPAGPGGGGHGAGTAYLDTLFKHVPVQDDSARKSLQTFTAGKGDVLLAYESEAVFARLKNQPIDYVVPDSTILIENPVAVTRNSRHPEQAEAFLRYLRSPAAQGIFARYGYRPVVDGADTAAGRFPVPRTLFTIADLGGWDEVTRRFFDPRGGVMATVERNIGLSVG